MGNRIFETVLNRKIENFTLTFVEDSSSIFFDNDNKLIHPGEYGKYRENSLKDLIKLITKHKVSDGFIITPNDQVSTQLDVVIYNNDEVPLLENNYIDFFSIESVIGIGEVKSTLNYTKFSEALQKLAQNKMLYDTKSGRCVQKNFNGIENDGMISFLVCASTSFDPQKINLEEIYHGIDRKYWHNFVLIIDKGLLGYQFNFSDLNENDRDLFKEGGGNLEAIVWYECSLYSLHSNVYKTVPVFHNLDTTNKHRHIKLFLTQLSQVISYKSLYSTDFVNYLNLPISPLFES